MAHQIEIYLEQARLVLENDFSAQRLPKAIQIYKEAIQQYPQVSVEPYLALGFLALRAGLDQEAETLLRRAASVEPFNSTVHKLLRHLKQKNLPTPPSSPTAPVQAIAKIKSIRRLSER